MLKPIRRHVKACSQYGKTGKDCPSAMKNKCPLVVHMYVKVRGEWKRRERKLDTNDMTVAQTLVNKMVVTGTKTPDKPPQTILEDINDFLDSEQARGIAPSTLRSYRKFLCGNPKRSKKIKYSPTLVEWAAANNITHLSQFDFKLVDDLRKTWRLNGRAMIVQSERLKQFFAAMHARKIISTNPAEALQTPNVVIEPVVAFDKGQRDALLDSVKDHPMLLAVNLVFKFTGIAPVDLVHLGPHKLQSNRIVYRRIKTRKNQGGKGKLLKVMIPESLVTLLTSLPVFPCGLWFWNKKTTDAKHETATGNLRRMMRPRFRKANVWLKDEDGVVVYNERTGKPKLGFLYQWRHTFVHMHLIAGTSIQRIAELIGDTPATVMETYAHFIQERQKGLDDSQERIFDAPELALLAVTTETDDPALKGE